MEKISHYCQKCRAANSAGERTCRRCGTRLMLVVFPPSMRHDDGIIPSYYEDHLLERVSLLELQLAQVLEKVKMAYEFFARESKELQKDHKFIRAFS
ncbi:MAG TPA: zinc-ribbon domain-containing protein, partial [Pyrinomonadaceae bacterium]|nr:zinc-ribbon domain-containing protein [Pyrinomonadaceae bacterium]